jgi:hypothetical protein
MIGRQFRQTGHDAARRSPNTGTATITVSVATGKQERKE